ncbi:MULTISPECIES: MerR family transcriptional regulator [Paenibacillus]|uniref:MerR family transcriptional regulator n=1 Tax=Paenibacillus campinasensis TaxID=66347 RepID=A0A268EZB5_9BACL|nr:MerR family transcriptional regulator [Paenibacillus campinasensis]MUG65212.1 MerR family transcriptional regulator [Paenibacillus campinasensis]PAD78472.1 MerR family transcriptional regulator [Paenibacillus campinasensis]
MKIGELSRKTGVSIRSLRYYEQQKLITPVRLDNGYREYSPFAVEQVKTIRLYLGLGFTTEQIAGFLHCVLQNKESFCREILPMYKLKIAELNEQIQLLTMIKSNLEERVHSILEENGGLAGQH